MVFIAVALWLNWEAPYQKIAKPIESRIHIGKDNDEQPKGGVEAVQTAAPAGGRQEKTEAVSSP